MMKPGDFGMGPEKAQEMMKMGQKMMGQMMGQIKDMKPPMVGFNPAEMCQKMTQSVAQSASMASFATPEVRALFEDWVREVEQEVLGLLKSKKASTPEEIAASLKISVDSALFFISKLIREKKVIIKTMEVNQAKEQTPAEDGRSSANEELACSVEGNNGG